MKKCCFVAVLLAICVLAATSLASAQLEEATTTTTPIALKTLQIGRMTYIGEDPNGDSAFTITLDTTDLGKTTVPLATPITFSSTPKWAVVGATGSFGPVSFNNSWTTPTELLNQALAPDGCPCFMAGVQLAIQTTPPGQPTITITLKNGNYITTSSTLNVFLTAKPGQQAIQLQQFAYVTLHAVQ